MRWDAPNRTLRICGWVSLVAMLLSRLLQAIGATVFGEFIWWVALGLVMAAAIGAMVRQRR